MTNEEQILRIVEENQKILEETYKSAEKTRKYFLFTMIITVLAFGLPLIGFLIAIPQFIEAFRFYSDVR